jgi:transcriptional regulator with XRE-family HTH domain
MGSASPGVSNILRNLTRIRAVREAAGLSRTELAERAGIGLSTLYLLEDGLIDTRLSTLMKVSKALGVTPGYLLGLVDRAA